MKVIHRQTKPFGCGHYALANLFNDERYLTHIEDETASFVIDLNKSLQEFTPDKLWISTIFCINTSLPIQNRFIDTALFDMDYDIMDESLIDGSFRPFLVTVKFPILFHLITVIHCFKNDLFYIVDSLRDEVREMTKEEFVIQYYVVEIFHFENYLIKESCKRGQENKTLFFNYNGFPHLKP